MEIIFSFYRNTALDWFHFVIQTVLINLNMFYNIWLRKIFEGWIMPKHKNKNLLNPMYSYNSGWERCSSILALLPLLLPEIRSLFTLSRYLPNYSQEVNRQNSTSSALSFLRWGGDESLGDDRKKAAKCVAPQLLALWLPKRFIYSSSEQNLSPPCYRKSNRTAKCRNACDTHNMGSQLSLHPGASQKAQSYPANDYVVPSYYRGTTSTFLYQCPFCQE